MGGIQTLHVVLGSTISTGLNALAAIALRDFMPAKMRESMSDKKQVHLTFNFVRHQFMFQAFLTKIFALFFGALTFAVTFVIRLGCKSQL